MADEETNIPMEELKRFLREDGKFNEPTIQLLWESAKSELKHSGVPDYEEDDDEYPLYKICLFLLVSRDYEKRSLESNELQALEKNVLRIRQFTATEEEVNSNEAFLEQPGEVLFGRNYWS